jgi:transmembrane sensor
VKQLDDKITAVPKWDKTAKQIWEERFEALTDTDTPTVGAADSGKAKSIRMRFSYILSAAAAVLILVSATAFVYNKNIDAIDGKNLITHLPDGSLAELAPGSSISYRPLLWMVSPSVAMKGEVYFSGHHRSGFKVNAQHGEIEVLGTAFDVNDIEDRMTVACVNGKVQVSNGGKSVVLTANMQATIQDDMLTSGTVEDIEEMTGWTRGVFSFYNRPLKEVIGEVERFFNVKVAMPEGADTMRYTGRFTRDKSAQEVLSIIGAPYGITFQMNK